MSASQHKRYSNSAKDECNIDNVPSPLTPQLLCGASCIWPYDRQLCTSTVHEAPKCLSRNKAIAVKTRKVHCSHDLILYLIM